MRAAQRVASPTFRANRILALRRAPWWRWVLAWVPVFLALFLASRADVVPLIALFVLLVGGLATRALGRRLTRARLDPVAVRAGAEGLEIGGRFHPRAEIVTGSLLHAPHRVILHRRLRRPLVLDTAGTRQGRALLRALGLDASQRVADFLVHSPLLARSGSLLGVVAGLVFLGVVALARADGMALGPFSIGGGALTVAWALGLLAPARVRVGTDGIGVRWLWSRRFLRFDEMAEIERFGRWWAPVARAPHVVGLRVALHSGKDVRLPVTLFGLGQLRLELLTERILQALGSFRRGDAEAAAHLLRRGDRSVGAWVRALRSLGSGANVDARTAPVPRDRLLRIVEDPGLPPVDRAAAAVALGAELDADGRARLRLAAAASALPRLRVAIETAADGAAEAELSAVLEGIEGIEERAPRARVGPPQSR
jgi:hypothetical protein